MNSKRLRWRERGKTLLILLLSLSAAYLTSRTILSGTPNGDGGLFASLSVHFSGTPQPSEIGTEHSGGLVHPARLVVSNGNQGRYGVQYDPETLETRFGGALLNLFSDALSGAGTPRPVTAHAWQSTLASQTYPVVYLDLLGGIPGDQLPVWLGGRAPNPALTGMVRRLFLTTDHGGMTLLYYSNESDGSYYACDVSPELTARLVETASGFPPNNAKFAFEDPAQYAGLAPYTLLLPETPRPRVYAASNPIGFGTADQTRFIQMLSFHPQSNAVNLNDLVVREGTDTLRVSPAGVVSYYSASAEDPRFPAGDTSAAMVDAAWAVLEGAVVPWTGAARLFLTGIAGEDGGTALYFAYQLDGAPVQVGGDGHAARFFFQDGRIAAFTLQLRHYEASGTTSIVLPEVQAAAAMSALDVEGGELLLCYRDTYLDQVEALWVTQGQG